VAVETRAVVLDTAGLPRPAKERRFSTCGPP